MKRQLLRSNTFIHSAKRIFRKNPALAADIQSALELLESDSFHPLLKTHKLKGELKNSWACSAGYDLRIVFLFVDYQGKKAILLEAIGTHEEVY